MAMPMSGVQANQRHANVRFRSGSRRRRTRMPDADQHEGRTAFRCWSTARSRQMLATAANMATKIPVRMVVTWGVRYLG